MDTRIPRDAILTAALERLRALGLAAAMDTRAARLRKAKADAVVRVGYGGREIQYVVELKRGLRPNGMGAVIHQMEQLGAQGLLVADYVTPPMAEILRARRIPFIDAAGNAFLDQPPLLVWIKGEKPQKTGGADRRTGRVFQASGMQVLFALICNPQWAELPYRDLALRANVAHGTVGWVMAELPGLGYIAEVGGTRRLIQRERLLQQWAQFYPRTLRPRLALGRYRAENLDWWSTLDPVGYGALLGGEPAGGRVTGYLRPGTATFYADKINPRLLVDLKLRTDPAGNVEIYRKFWTFDTDLPGMTPAALIYADLMATGDGRCIETAKLIYGQLFR